MASHYQCAFCDKFHTEVRLLIEAEKGCICDSCVLTCTELMTNQLGKDWPKKARVTKAGSLKKLFLLPIEESATTFNLLKMLKDDKVITEQEFMARSREPENSIRC